MGFEALDLTLDSAEETKAEARALDARLADASTLEILDEAVHRIFPGEIALVSSFGADSAVLLHLLSEVDRAVPVVFIDTGKLFGETRRHRDALVARLGLTDVRTVTPKAARLASTDPSGALWMSDKDLCCRIRKVEPLADAVEGFSAWITGRKRYQSATRARLPVVEADGTRIKVNPLAGWSRADLDAWRLANDLPEHPLVAEGYRSIGCMPCTDRVADGEDERAGRWRGTAKTECGIHLGLIGREADGSGI